MNDTVFDETLIKAFFSLAAEKGWARASAAQAAKNAELDQARVRARFPSRLSILARLNYFADQHAVSGSIDDESVRAGLFDLLMRRLDILQRNRSGVIALMRALPFDPASGLALAGLTLRSMRWLLDEVGVETGGLVGPARVAALSGIWGRAIHIWQKDGSEDLSLTMAALDKLLGQAEKASRWLCVGNKNASRPDKTVEQGAPDSTPEGATAREHQD